MSGNFRDWLENRRRMEESMADQNREAWLERADALAQAHATMNSTAEELFTQLTERRREGGSIAEIGYRYLRYQIASDRFENPCRAYIEERLFL
jgi:hypothetical protein